ncbi:aminopeptidase P family protein [Pullulanibacillus sp. KACC 23026]|uniref:aminopeptidase P family protein n=1 Tax=Pullulanibacillus sp. KACC 23026 TaxID=3028315 RepID=UPI0023AE7283|nr:aminopeptidase P family protein [Pullulanibacillus sp. KACC 23026]WEG13204.1 aminopeptidase P family protein [Pullulanibacillus sp. KACC 23026]
MESSFFTRNRARLAEQIEEGSLAVFFAGEAPHKSADEGYDFYPNLNFYYLTGIDEPKVILVLNKIYGKVKETLFIQKADPVRERWEGKTISAPEAMAASGIESVQYIEDFHGFLQGALISHSYSHLYLDLERRHWDAPLSASQKFASDIGARYPYLQIHNAYPAICELRVIKSKEEVDEIKEAGRITSEAIKFTMTHTKPGMNESEIEAYFDFGLKTRGVKHHAFHTIAAAGENGTILHYGKNNSPTKDGDLILLDLGAKWNYYSADISYTYPLNGKFTDRQKTIYNIVLRALREITEMIKPGVKFNALQERTKEILAEECKAIGLIKEDSELFNYYFHGVSHYLGLDTHDVGSYGNLDRVRELEAGMVITVEPGLYIAEEGIGIRIEDDVLVTEDGFEVLTPDLPRTVEEIEAFMANRK